VRCYLKCTYVHMSSRKVHMYICLHVKYPSFLSDINETWIFSTDFRKTQRNIMKFVQRQPSCSMRTGRQTDMTKLIVAFRSFANAPKAHIQAFISIQPWRPGLAGTRAQSYDRYGSGTLHPGQVLRGSLPLLSPAFRRSHFSRQVPPSATMRQILAAKGGTVGEKDVR